MQFIYTAMLEHEKCCARIFPSLNNLLLKLDYAVCYINTLPKNMICFRNHIIFDDIEFWPSEMLGLIRENKKLFKGFLEDKHRIDELQ